MNFAKLEKSQRLQRLLMLLSTGREYTTLQIIELARVAAVSAAVSELRHNGVPVNCRQTRDGDSRVYSYQLAEFAGV